MDLPDKVLQQIFRALPERYVRSFRCVNKRMSTISLKLLTDLPNELLELIFNSLSQRDSLNARQLTKHMYGMITPKTFKRVYFALRKKRLAILKDICKSPGAKKSVKTLVFDTRLFDPQVADRMAYSVYDDRPNHFDQSHQHGLAGPYVSLYTDQFDKHRYGSSWRALSRAFKKLPKIETLIIGVDFERTELIFPQQDHTWYRDSCLKEFEGADLPTVGDFFPSRLSLVPWWHDDYSKSDLSCIFNSSFWRKCASTKIRLKELQLGSGGVPVPHDIFCLSKSGFNALCTVASGLERLGIYYHLGAEDLFSQSSPAAAYRARREQAHDTMLKLLVSLVNLQQLSFRANPWQQNAQVRPTLSRIVFCRLTLSRDWTALVHINLEGVDVDLENFKMMGSCCRETLRDIRLTVSALSSKSKISWIKISEWVRENLILDRLYLAKVYLVNKWNGPVARRRPVCADSLIENAFRLNRKEKLKFSLVHRHPLGMMVERVKDELDGRDSEGRSSEDESIKGRIILRHRSVDQEMELDILAVIQD